MSPELESVFFEGKVDTLLYISLALSFVSMINTRVKLESWSKMDFFRAKGKILFGFHTFNALVLKVQPQLLSLFSSCTLASSILRTHKNEQCTVGSSIILPTNGTSN